METNKWGQSVGDVEPKATRPKLETVGNTSSQKSGAAEPFLSLPSHILAKIIVNVPIAQWHALELLDEHFRDATMIAWRQLRQINVEREFEMKKNDPSVTGKSTESILRKLTECSPLLTSMSGINVPSLPTDAISSLARFEHLQSITMGDAKKFVSHHRKMPLEVVTEFLESTRSRASLKELRFVDIAYVSADRAAILEDRFASSLANGQEIRSPLKLEKFMFSSSKYWPKIRLDNMDATRLTELNVGKAAIEPQQLTDLIERASNLHRIEFSFLDCHVEYCVGPHLVANKKLLAALSSHENLTAIKFDCLFRLWHCDTTAMNFGNEFIEMLKAIGRRGRLRNLAMEEAFVPRSILAMDDVCTTIRDHIPYLQSIKLDMVGVSEERVRDVVSLPELEEVNLTNCARRLSANIIGKIVQLPDLKRLAIDSDFDDETTSFERLAYATKLMHLRIGPAHLISADTFEKWAAAEGGFASRLEILMLGPVSKKRVNENGLVQFLEKAVRLRVLVLLGRISSRPLAAIAKSCPLLKVLSVNPYQEKLTVRRLQEIVDRCPKLKRFGGMEDEMRDKVSFPKYRQIGDVDKWNSGRDFDEDMYEG